MRTALECCDTNGASTTVLRMPRPATGETFIARVRVKLEKWQRFSAAAAVQGTDRSKVLNDLIDWYLRDRVAPERPTRGDVNAMHAELRAEAAASADQSSAL